jgi:hypothetical protein
MTQVVRASTMACILECKSRVELGWIIGGRPLTPELDCQEVAIMTIRTEDSVGLSDQPPVIDQILTVTDASPNSFGV